ncbi:MAG TPA: hypothetical protein VKA46_04245 [Gemmataceae bacterium]|nr:hypothetical protein [Gemmataceae bacterium]
MPNAIPAPDALAKQLRWEQTRREFNRLATEFGGWHKDAVDADERNRYTQYKTQLKAIEDLMTGAHRRLVQEFDRPALLGLETGDLYEVCKTYDLRIVWLRRVWQFFREKFDQRHDTEGVGAVLRAADEVVWSCYRQPFAWAEENGVPLGAPQGAAPLPFIESRYSPEAFPTQFIPEDLEREIDPVFKAQVLTRLPIPVMRLSPACVSAPWWLVFVAHEVGHHLQYDLCPAAGLVDAYKQLVKAAVGGHADPKAADEWAGWSRELFADVVSVLLMGSAAVWGMVELEWANPWLMLRRRNAATAAGEANGYPPAVVRLAFLREVANQVGLDGTSALRGIQPKTLAAADDVALRDLTLAPHVARASLGSIPCLPAKLPELLAFSLQDHLPGPNSRVEHWKNALPVGPPEPTPEESLRAARQITSGALEAWAALTRNEASKADRDGRREKLVEQVPAVIRKSREPRSRASQRPPAPSEDLGKELADALLGADLAALQRGGVITHAL